MAIIEILTPNGCSTWPLDTRACDIFEDFPPPVTGRAASIAVSNLYFLTGGAFGTCEATYRPCVANPPSQYASYNSGRAYPPGLLTNRFTPSTWRDLACSGSCDSNNTLLTLPIYPIQSIRDVTVGDISYDPALFEILNRRTIAWQAGEPHHWPLAQNLSQPLGSPNTWSITLAFGHPLPPDTATVTGLYACELAKLFTDQECALPGAVTNLSRQGITFQFVPPDYIDRGLLGYDPADRFVLNLNPHRLRSRASASSIDTLAARPHRVTL